MKRSSLNFIIDLIGFISLVCLACTGVIIKYVLPPGSGGRGRLLHGGRGGEHVKDQGCTLRGPNGGQHGVSRQQKR